MITQGKNPFELGSASDHLGSAASYLRDSIDDMRRLGADLAVLAMLTDAMTLCANLSQQLDKAAETELARVNLEPAESVEAIIASLNQPISGKNHGQTCPTCRGKRSVVGTTGLFTCCRTCDGAGVA